MTAFSTTDAALIEQGLLINARLISKMPDNYLRDSEIQRLMLSARKHKLDGLQIIARALNVPANAKPEVIKPSPEVEKQSEGQFTCPNCKRSFKSQQALKGHRPHKCHV